MKTVTTQFLETLKQPGVVPKRTVYYKRRHWQQSTNTYIWETNWTLLPENKVVSVPPITWQLDTVTLNVFKVSNVTIVLENLQNQWNPKNKEGLFGNDAGSPLFGYEFYFTKFQIRAGFDYGLGSSESIPIFTGVATEYTINSANGGIQITVAGEEQILINADAEQVSTTYTNEVVGTGTGSLFDFFTAHLAVGIIVEVSDNGVVRRAGADYTLSQLNDPALAAKISFTIAPLAGHTIRCTYRTWYTGKKFEELIGLLLTQAGIPPGQQQVQSVVFPGNIINRHTWQTQSDWTTGTTLTNIDYLTTPDAIRYQMGVYQNWNSTLTGWTQGGTNGSFAVDGTGLYASGNPTVRSIYRSSTYSYGRWTCYINVDSYITGSIGNRWTWEFFINTLGSFGTGTLTANGYMVWWQTSPSKRTFLYKKTAVGTFVLLAQSTSFPAGSTDVRFDVERFNDGTINVYQDGTLILTANDSTYTVCNYYAHSCQFSATTQKIYFNNTGFLVASSNSPTAEWQSGTVDFGATPSAWGAYTISEALNGGTDVYYTRSSPNGSSWEAWMLVLTGGVVQSTLDRYFQTKVDITIQSGEPIITQISAGSLTSSTVITIANFTGMTCYDAIASLGTFANYEYGFDAYENFFFRARPTTATPVFTATTKDYIDRVLSMSSGYDRVYSIVRAIYGAYTHEVQDDGLAPSSPKAIIAKVIIEINGGAILTPSDSDIATGVANSFLAYYNKSKRRVKFTGKMLPFLDLSDVIETSTYDTFGPSPNWYLGDNSQTLNPSGSTPLTLYGEGEQTIFDFIGKIIGIRYDTDNWTSEIDLEEIPS